MDHPKPGPSTPFQELAPAGDTDVSSRVTTDLGIELLGRLRTSPSSSLVTGALRQFPRLHWGRPISEDGTQRTVPPMPLVTVVRLSDEEEVDERSDAIRTANVAAADPSPCRDHGKSDPCKILPTPCVTYKIDIKFTFTLHLCFVSLLPVSGNQSWRHCLENLGWAWRKRTRSYPLNFDLAAHP
jgi:hypothetical protein